MAPLIPPRVVFTYRKNLLVERKSALNPTEQRLTDNVWTTIRMNYLTGLAVDFYDDDGCERVLLEVPHGRQLVGHYRRESFGPFKADLCRVAALYATGGVYFDVDLVSRLPVWDLFSESTDFATAKSAFGSVFFQAFLGSVPKHPVLERYLGLSLDWYEGHNDVREQIGEVVSIGPALLLLAYREIQPHPRAVLLLQEVPRSAYNKMIANASLEAETVAPQVSWLSRCTNDDFVVYDPTTMRVPFYSRLHGVKCSGDGFDGKGFVGAGQSAPTLVLFYAAAAVAMLFLFINWARRWRFSRYLRWLRREQSEHVHQ